MKRTIFAASFAALPALAASAWMVACLDMTLLAPSPDAAAPDASMADAPIEGDGGGDAPVDLRPPCQKCIETAEDAGGCGNETATCLADPTCNSIYTCAVAKGCFERGTTRAAVTCGLPCASAAGVSDPADPAITLVTNIVVCATRACVGRCFPEAGAPDAAATD